MSRVPPGDDGYNTTSDSHPPIVTTAYNCYGRRCRRSRENSAHRATIMGTTV